MKLSVADPISMYKRKSKTREVFKHIIGGRGRSEISKFDTKFKNYPRLKKYYPILIKK